MQFPHNHSFIDTVVVYIGIGYNGPISGNHHRCLQTAGLLLQGKNLRIGQTRLIKALSIVRSGPFDVQHTLSHCLSAVIDSKCHFGTLCSVSKAFSNTRHPAKRLARLKPHRFFPRLSFCMKVPKGAVITGSFHVRIVAQNKVEVEGRVPCGAHHW